MSMAEDIAKRVNRKGEADEGSTDANDEANVEAKLKAGDYGKRIRAAMKMEGSEGDLAIEEAIRDCLADHGDSGAQS